MHGLVSRSRTGLVFAIVAAVALVGAAVAASTTEVVNEDDLGVNWQVFVLGDGTSAFAAGPGTPPLGGGSFHMTTTASPDKVTLFNYDYIGTRLADVGRIEYATYRSSSSTSPAHLVPSLNVQVDYIGDGSSFTTLVWEPIYAYGAAAIQDDIWQLWDARDSAPGSAGGWWSTKQIPGVCAFNCFVSWETITANNPDAVVKIGFGVNYGRSSGAFAGAVDALTIGVGADTVSYDFEPKPFAKEDCKNGGWANFVDPVFRNQGDCVSFFASGGRTHGH